MSKAKEEAEARAEARAEAKAEKVKGEAAHVTHAGPGPSAVHPPESGPDPKPPEPQPALVAAPPGPKAPEVVAPEPIVVPPLASMLPPAQPLARHEPLTDEEIKEHRLLPSNTTTKPTRTYRVSSAAGGQAAIIEAVDESEAIRAYVASGGEREHVRVQLLDPNEIRLVRGETPVHDEEGRKAESERAEARRSKLASVPLADRDSVLAESKGLEKPKTRAQKKAEAE